MLGATYNVLEELKGKIGDSEETQRLEQHPQGWRNEGRSTVTVPREQSCPSLALCGAGCTRDHGGRTGFIA